jgi:putative ABC transport system permease protein
MGQGVNGEAESKFFTTLNVEEGLPLSTEPNGIVLGYGLARSLGVVVGDRVTVLSNTIAGSINGVDLAVTGVFHTGSKDFDDVVFRIPLAQAQILLDTQKVETVAIGLDETVPWKTFAAAASTKFPNLESTPFEVLDKVYYQHSVDWLGQQFDVIKTVILAIVLLGILNSISTSVLERKQEIGNLRANGESSWDVMKLLLSEGAILGALGALLGLALAWIVVNTVLRHGIYMPAAPGITRRFYVLIELQPAYALVTFSLGCCCAIVGTLFAGIRVARMNIAEALRSL